MRFIVCAGLLFCCALSQNAYAQDDSSLRVTWNAPERCGSSEAVIVRVFDQLEHMAMPPVSARVYAVAQGSVLQLAILVDLNGATAVREIEARDCDHAVEIASVVIALALQEHEGLAPTDSVADAPVGASSQTSPASGAHESTSPTRARPPSLHLAAHMAFVASAGTAPDPSVGFALGLRVSLQRWAITLRGIAHPGSRAPLTAGSDLGTRFNRSAGMLALGYGIGLDALTLTPAVGLSIGELHGEGVGVVNAADAHRLWLAPFASLQLDWALLGRLALSAVIDAEVPIYRPVFSIVGAGAVFQPPPIALSASLGVTWTFL